MRLIDIPLFLIQSMCIFTNIAFDSICRSFSFFNILLFSFGSSALKILNFFMGARVILSLYEKNGVDPIQYRHKRKLLLFFILALTLLSLLSLFFLDPVHLYPLYPLGLFPFGKNVATFIANDFILLASNPFIYFILYALGVYFFDLTKKKSLKIMRLAYTLLVGMIAFINIIHMLFPMHLVGLNLLGCAMNQDIFMFFTATISVFVFYFFILKFIRKFKKNLNFEIYEDSTSEFRSLCYNFFLCCMAYLATIFVLCDKTVDIFHLIFLLILLFSMISISIFKDCIFQFSLKLNSHEKQIQQLIHSITEFESIKHDFHNILQTYTNYLHAKDYQNLRVYHQKLVDATVLAESNLNIHLRIPENPSFFSLLANKLDKAKKEQVVIQISLLSNMTDLYIEELDLNRIISILLDNAIEAAIETDSKRVNISSHTREDQSKFFIISNDTTNMVDQEKIFLQGYSTKKEHMGQGLPQVRSIVNSYPNISFHVNFYPGIFTVYMDFKPKGRN